jgi:hypothetical protein
LGQPFEFQGGGVNIGLGFPATSLVVRSGSFQDAHGKSKELGTAMARGAFGRSAAEIDLLVRSGIVLRGNDLQEMYDLARQSSVGLPSDQPVETLETIAVGTINLLEAIRFLDRPIHFYSAGSSESLGEAQARAPKPPFRPRSPYAVAMGTAHWLVTNYTATNGLHASTGMLFNHEALVRAELAEAEPR